MKLLRSDGIAASNLIAIPQILTIKIAHKCRLAIFYFPVLARWL